MLWFTTALKGIKVSTFTNSVPTSELKSVYPNKIWFPIKSKYLPLPLSKTTVGLENCFTVRAFKFQMLLPSVFLLK